LRRDSLGSEKRRRRAGVELSIVDGVLQGVVTSLGRPSTHQNLVCATAAFRDDDRRPWSYAEVFCGASGPAPIPCIIPKIRAQKARRRKARLARY